MCQVLRKHTVAKYFVSVYTQEEPAPPPSSSGAGENEVISYEH